MSSTTTMSLSGAPAEVFLRHVEQFSYRRNRSDRARALTNVTFFAGAGFSKAWDPKAPIGCELFTLDTKLIRDVADAGSLARMFGLDASDRITPETLRQIVYQLDMYDRFPDVRPRYLDEQNLRMFRGALRAAVLDRYDRATRLNYFDGAAGRFPLVSPSARQRDIMAFFRHLRLGSVPEDPWEGVRTHFITTNYDYVIETILDNLTPDAPPLFFHTYRGFTPVQIAGGPGFAPVHEHWQVQHLLKINGGFEILRRGHGYVLDYGKRDARAIMADPPVVTLASREQDYSDPYFAMVFPKVVRLMRDSTILVIVGYSLPSDDALIRFFLRQFAEEPEDGLGKVIFYLGPGDAEEKRQTIAEVFPAMERMEAPQLVTYDSGFDQFAQECLDLLGRRG
ncbi:SIR2 family protein [Paracoccus sp. AK26]|uniref:SIR2 family protein n=1 Tax=Paracoccus sp. AK26 TaxID=2589076 RepID=UPI001430282F|nr:SIR2 family protein [Paracoccus sp. AK26]